jgi:hypothetical protein
MKWKFDQAPNVACLASRAVFDGRTVLVVTHYEDDHSWAFLDGTPFDPKQTFVVAMSEVLNVHPELVALADLPTGWTASRESNDQPWLRLRGE